MCMVGSYAFVSLLCDATIQTSVIHATHTFLVYFVSVDVINTCDEEERCL